jgi:hypothetical protein
MRRELLELEERGWRALVDGNGPDFYEDVCTEDAVMLFPGGMVLDRDDAIEGLRQAPPWATYELSDTRVVPLDDDAAVVVYRVTAQRDGDEPYRAAMSSTYVRRGGAWKLAVHQQTPG